MTLSLGIDLHLIDVDLQILAPIAESQEAGGRQIFPPQQKHDDAAHDTAVQAA